MTSLASGSRWAITTAAIRGAKSATAATEARERAMVEPLRWQIGTVTGIRPQTERVSSFTISLPDWRPHRPGQHYDVRLTAEDGYQAQRSYSIASAADRNG